MLAFVAIMVAGAAFYFAWRRSPEQPKRLVANIGGVVAILFLLLAIYGIVVYFQTSTP